MRNYIYWLVVVIAITVDCQLRGEVATFGEGDNAFLVEFVPIGNPGNSPDPGTRVVVGAVDYTYAISKYEVSQSMIKKANAASMHDGTGGGLEISVHELYRDSPDQAATGLTWDESARFVNWLNVSTGYAPAYRFNTQPGDAEYDIYEDVILLQEGDPGFNPANPMRSTLARYVIPSLDEWYKAGFHDSASGTEDVYFDYATGSDTGMTVPIKKKSFRE